MLSCQMKKFVNGKHEKSGTMRARDYQFNVYGG